MPSGVFIRTQAHKDNIGKAHKGRIVSIETRNKISAIRTGTKASEETRKKLSLKMIGNTFRNKGSLPTNPFEHGHIPWNKGKTLGPLTLECKKNLSKALRGSNNPNWQGGKISIKQSVRQSFEYKTWRTAILQRDNYTCLLCGQRGYKLNVDHYPKSYAQIIRDNNLKSIDDFMCCEELWDINNNRTLCFECHKATPNYLTRKKQ